MNNGATFSPCYKYRYALWRIWQEEVAPLCFIMLNPSTADAEKNDATIRKCMGFARQMAYGGIKIVNLFAWRATKPYDLWRQNIFGDAIGLENDDYISAIVSRTITEGGHVVCAWGNHPKAYQRVAVVKATLKFFNVPVHALQLNGNGSPAHPLMLPYSCELRDFEL